MSIFTLIMELTRIEMLKYYDSRDVLQNNAVHDLKVMIEE